MGESKFLVLILCIFFIPFNGYNNYPVKNLNSFIIENSICKNDPLFENELEVLFRKYSVVFIGEVHGSMESSRFVYFLAKLLSSQRDVCVSLEIPKREMVEFSGTQDTLFLDSCTFFKKENIDGRNGRSWNWLIRRLVTINNLKLEFIDNYDSGEHLLRDSLMYLEILKTKKKYPNKVLISLTGNYHNSIDKRINSYSIADYVKQDSIDFDFDSIMTIRHFFSKGLYVANFGNGLEEKKVERSMDLFYNKSTCNEYFVEIDWSWDLGYNGIFYSEFITPSY